MAIHMFDTQGVTTTGVKPANSLTKFPEFGATVGVGFVGGTGPTCTVQFRAWLDSNFKEVLATFTLPVPIGNPNSGNLYDSVPIASQWENFDWNVQAIAGAPTLKLMLSGVGL